MLQCTARERPNPLGSGTRLLVAGDGGFASACGFTQPYDAGTAQEWATALSG